MSNFLKVRETVLMYSALFTSMSAMEIFIEVSSNLFKNKSRNTVRGSLQIKLLFFSIINGCMSMEYSPCYIC